MSDATGVPMIRALYLPEARSTVAYWSATLPWRTKVRRLSGICCCSGLETSRPLMSGAMTTGSKTVLDPPEDSSAPLLRSVNDARAALIRSCREFELSEDLSCSSTVTRARSTAEVATSCFSSSSC